MMPQPNRPVARLPWLRTIGAGLALLLLSGCANKDVQSFLEPLKQGLADLDQKLHGSDTEQAAQVESADSEAPPQTAARSPARAADPAEKKAGADGVPVAESTTQPAAAQIASVPRAAAPALHAASELVGIESTMVEQRLGSPALRRRDAPAELWQYRSPFCVMDVFLYSDGRSSKVMHVELHPRSAEQIPAPACLASFDEPHKPSPTAG
jgi:hypothetical protein